MLVNQNIAKISSMALKNYESIIRLFIKRLHVKHRGGFSILLGTQKVCPYFYFPNKGFGRYLDISRIDYSCMTISFLPRNIL